ncbi:MAG: SpoIIE family protein phosphatase [Gemmatimonadales bacterium]|nr:SpoIIE family protein phosphatase [Gemmatimonadales bacterium]MYG48228.1 SpoIIE family protein phosphatase [Gemmatimonadales bacterium]MYK01140.1 SpoIIE family protein phosphatase [Candidatus Palauibacter ramosifaciens]
MKDGAPARILVLSSRPDILRAVADAAAEIDPPPEVRGLFGRPLNVLPTDLILVDVAEPRATMPYLHRRFGAASALVALIDGAWVDRLGSALAGDWTDYLFHPLNAAELGFVWKKHTSPAEAPNLNLDVDESGRIRVVFPSHVRYQRAVVERVVVACRHLADLDRETAFRLRVTLGEAVANAILYGSGDRPGAVVRISAKAYTAGLRVKVSDEGSGFNPEAVPDPVSAEGIGRPRGRGLFLLRQLADGVAFNETGNSVTLSFRGAPDPLVRIEPLLRRFADVTGLRFRLDRLFEDGSQVLFDSWEDGEDPGGPPEVRETWPLGDAGRLRLVHEPVRRGDAAAALLAGWIGAVAEGEQSQERLLARRLRRERVLAELEIARDLQLKLLPPPEDFRDLGRIAARCDPALSLGGDFYYLVRLADGCLGVMLGDVSSHGPSAALIMARTLSAAVLATGVEAEPAAVLDAMHGQLRAALDATEMYMTLFYGVIDPERGELRYANAGHPYAYLLGPDGVRRLTALDPPVGVAAVRSFRQTRLPSGGETLLAFTDGLAELSDPLETPDSRVRRRIDRGDLDPEVLVAALFADSDDEMRLDDRTAVAASL